jgi:hypothetical protein
VNLTLSPQMKIVALVGVIAVLALGGGTMILGRSKPATGAAASTTPLRHFTPTVVAKPATHAVPKTNKHSTLALGGKHAVTRAHVKNVTPVHVQKSAAPAKPVVKAAAAKPAPLPLVAANGLPTPLDMLLHGHRVVVVALWDPEIPSDRLAFLEAQAGAKDANAGFLAVSVLDERVAGPLTTVAGNGTLLTSPGLLIYKQPFTLMNKINGFTDRQSVAEAVANALLAEAPPAGLNGAPAAPAAAGTPTATPTPAQPGD